MYKRQVNNQNTGSISGFATAYDYPAFSERRAFLAGWGYAMRTRDAGYDRVLAGFNPFADRKALNDRALRGDPEAVAELQRRFGVGYILIDEVNGYEADPEKLERLGRVAFSADGVEVIELDPPEP